MNYDVYVSASNFSLPESRVECALEGVLKVKGPLERVLSKIQNSADWDSMPLLRLRVLVKKVWGFTLKFDHVSDLDVIKIQWIGDFGILSDEMSLFNALAPFAIDGSYIEMTGEDGCKWRYLFKNGICKKIYPKIIWEDCDASLEEVKEEVNRENPSKSEKVVCLGLKRELGYLYFLRGCDVYRTAMKKAGSKVVSEDEKVADGTFQRDPGFVYFLDSVGDISRTKRSIPQ